MSNLDIWEQAASVPKEAQKTIGAGRLKGFTDINPMWRIKKLTEIYGPCGTGWKPVVKKYWTEQGSEDEITAFCSLDLYVRDKEDGEWSEPIPGIGGSKLKTREKSGPYVSDECVDGDCEVLTPDGWVAFKNYDGVKKIAQFDKNTSEISFVEPTRFIHKISSDLYDKGGIIMTAHHRNLVYRQSCGDRVVLLAEDFAKRAFLPSRNGYGRSKAFKDIKCGSYGEPKHLTPEQRVGIMIACDGTLYRENTNGDIYWRLEFSKQRKIKKAKEFLQEAGIEFRESLNKRRNGTITVSYTFNLNGAYKDYRYFLQFGNYPDLWDEIVSWDGCKTGGVETFCTTKKENAEYLQTLLALSGETVTISTRKHKNPKHHDTYVLYKKKHRTGSCGFKRYSGELDVYCVEVPTTFFLIRKSDEIYVTGNCYKMAFTDALSVACKLLGFGADVYWSAGRSGSKYQETNPVSANPASTDDNPLGTCCACCGKPIHDTTIDGKTWPVDVIVTESIKRYGVPLHIDCAKTYKPKKEDK